MRLLVFTTQFPPAVGGVETMTWQLSKHLQSMAEDVTVLTPEASGAATFDAGETLRIKRYPLSNPQTSLAKLGQKMSLVKTLKQAIIETQAEVVLCTGWDPCAYIASIACARSRVPYFLIAHGMELLQLPRRLGARQTKTWMRRRALAGAKRIIAVSSFTRDRVVQLGVPKQRVSVVPNGVVLAERKRAVAANSNGQVLMTVSRLVPRKGHDTVIRALPRVLAQMPKAVYRIVGTGPELQRLQTLTSQLELNNHVQFYGQVSDDERERLLDECNVFVLATRETATDFEGLGIAVLEAMQIGKPVVVTRAGGVPEIVDHGTTGLVVEPDDPNSLADAIVALLSDPARASVMGNNAESAVRERFSWPVIASRYLAEVKASI
jgi:phosphatidylinositol alpha-1,6-mannosyltransferase